MSHRLPGPKRPMPPDFPMMFVLLGWDAIEDHYETGQTIVLRWMREAGEFRLIELRRAYLRKVRASQGIATIMGVKPGRKFGGIAEMRSGDPALEFMPIRRVHRRYLGEITFPPVTLKQSVAHPPTIATGSRPACARSDAHQAPIPD